MLKYTDPTTSLYNFQNLLHFVFAKKWELELNKKEVLSLIWASYNDSQGRLVQFKDDKSLTFAIINGKSKQGSEIVFIDIIAKTK